MLFRSACECDLTDPSFGLACVILTESCLDQSHRPRRLLRLREPVWSEEDREQDQQALHCLASGWLRWIGGDDDFGGRRHAPERVVGIAPSVVLDRSGHPDWDARSGSSRTSCSLQPDDFRALIENHHRSMGGAAHTLRPQPGSSREALSCSPRSPPYVGRVLFSPSWTTGMWRI